MEKNLSIMVQGHSKPSFLSKKRKKKGKRKFTPCPLLHYDLKGAVHEKFLCSVKYSMKRGKSDQQHL